MSEMKRWPWDRTTAEDRGAKMKPEKPAAAPEVTYWPKVGPFAEPWEDRRAAYLKAKAVKS